MENKLTMLMILDGFGINTNEKGNAVKLANTPNIDKLMETCPTTEIYTSGMHVGLPERTNGKFRSRTYKHWRTEGLCIKN